MTTKQAKAQILRRSLMMAALIAFIALLSALSKVHL